VAEHQVVATAIRAIARDHVMAGGPQLVSKQ
jgi:hypothetical protein